MKTIKKQVRQGDVLLTKTKETVLSESKVSTAGPVTLALGEATGHHHTVSGECALYIDEGNKITGETPAQIIARLGGGVITADGVLTHQEHGPAKLKGTYKVTIQREYQRGAIRNVAD